MASAGRVLLISKGAWVSDTSYDPMDFVYDGGNSYVCKASVSGSTAPSSDTTHWQLMASGFDATLITQTITNDADKIASDAAVYTECQKLESNFAVIQASNVATQAFAIGDYLTYQGELHKVTSAIANGGTITPGTNCTKTNVGTQLDALNDSLVGLQNGYTFSYYYDNKFYFSFQTCGDIIVCDIAYGTAMSLPTSWTTLGEYPSNIGKIFSFISIPLVGGAVVTIRHYQGDVQFQCSSSASLYPQGCGAGRLRT